MAAVVRGKDITRKPFDNRLCLCGHPAGIHGDYGCWSYGLVDPKCRKHCKGFRLDNLWYLAKKYDDKQRKHRK